MSKQQAILETLLGAAELNGNKTLANRIRSDIQNIGNRRQAAGYQRLALAAGEGKREHRKAA
ncbi:MAG TPA: hypothetical protein VHX86_07535 [Tepidisphaeraceae bacterium]|jgi:hypothetical protein|nr:hypothetical protein [Tepidisphaeraceae bacterium]